MAPQNPDATLEALPTEILQVILSQLACTEDLYAVIRASPRMLQSFLGQREPILIRVIESSLEPVIFMQILAVLHAPNFSDLHFVPDELELAELHSMHDPTGLWSNIGWFLWLEEFKLLVPKKAPL